MAFTDLQERRILALEVSAIARMVVEGRVSIEDLRELASKRMEFASKLALIESEIAMLPDPQETNAYETLMMDCRAANTPDEHAAILERLKTYICRWENTPSAQTHVAEAKHHFEFFDELIRFEKIRKRAEAAIAANEQSGKVPNRELSDELNRYVRDYGQSLNVSEEHKNLVLDWKEQVEKIRKEAFDRDYELLFDMNGVLLSLEAYHDFRAKYELTAEKSLELDNDLWNWALHQSDVLKAVGVYSQLTNGMGAHSADVTQLRHELQEWNAVDKDDIFAVITFKNSHLGTLLNALIQERFTALKGGELDKIRRAPSKYSAARFLALLDSGACTEEELLQTTDSVGDTEVIQRIRNVNAGAINVKQIPDVDTFTGITEGNGKTDIVLFGTSYAGKTCLLTGILSNGRININADDWSGSYGQALESYGRAQVAPPPNAADINIATMIRCELYLNEDGSRVAPFNLVDMAGAVLTQAIAGYDQGLRDDVSFADMGTGATDILSNGHDKIFLIIVDPTATGAQAELQINVVQRLLSIMQNPSNEDIMSKVRGLHFIVTKADTLQGHGRARLEHARRVVYGIINEGTRIGLRKFCRLNGTNSSKDKELDGRPRVFCNSLGKFYPGNIFTFNKADSDVMLEMITDYVVVENSGGIGRKIREVFTQRF